MRAFTSTTSTAFLSLQTSTSTSHRHHHYIHHHHRQRTRSEWNNRPQTFSSGQHTTKIGFLAAMSKSDGEEGTPKDRRFRLHYQQHDREEDFTFTSQHQNEHQDVSISILFNVISHIYDNDNGNGSSSASDSTSHMDMSMSLSSENKAIVDDAISSLGDLIATSRTQMLRKNNGRGTSIISEHEFQSMVIPTSSSSCHKMKLTKASVLAAQSLRNLMVHYGPGRGMGRKALMATVAGLLDDNGHVNGDNGDDNDNPRTIPKLSNTLATISLVAALSIYVDVKDPLSSSSENDYDYQHASRAAVSGLLPKGRYENQKLHNRKKNANANANVSGEGSSSTSTSTSTKQSEIQNNFGVRAVCALLDMSRLGAGSASASQYSIDLHIVTGLARAFVSDNTTPSLANACAKVIRQTLLLNETNETNGSSDLSYSDNHNNGNDGNDDGNSNGVLRREAEAKTETEAEADIEIDKKIAAATFGLAAEIGPWDAISCVSLVNLSIDMSLWHAAERLCASAVQTQNISTSESSKDDGVACAGGGVNDENAHSHAHAHHAVHVLIDRSFEQHLYRQADSLATTFYDHGGRSRYAEARFLHACSTISKVVCKRQFPIIERQIERVDKAIDRVRKDRKEHSSSNTSSGQQSLVEDNDDNDKDDDEDRNDDAKVQVREFALTRLREVNEHDVAHRLAVLWNMEYMHDSDDAEKYLQARREKYLQWDEAFSTDDIDSTCSSSKGDIVQPVPVPVPVPEVISNGDELKIAFEQLISTINDDAPVVGFDVEWGDECQGAALLQLSTLKCAILIDIPALSQSPEGCQSLTRTVGRLFGSKRVKLLGFSCRQDLSRLRNSPSVTHMNIPHWFSSTDAVVDIKPLIALDTPKVKELGLSRVSEHYLGKLLDKAEQCSQWEKRPLSENQRVYAALDAWAVTAVYAKLSTFTKSLTGGKRLREE